MSEAIVRVVKETLKKTKVVKGAALDRALFVLNSMSRADSNGSPVDLFLGRNVNTFLPNAGTNICPSDVRWRKGGIFRENGWRNWGGYQTRTSRLETWSKYKILEPVFGASSGRWRKWSINSGGRIQNIQCPGGKWGPLSEKRPVPQAVLVKGRSAGTCDFLCGRGLA